MTIDEYIQTQPEAIQPLLQAVRDTIRTALPDAEERFSYRICQCSCCFFRSCFTCFQAFQNRIFANQGNWWKESHSDVLRYDGSEIEHIFKFLVQCDT